MNYINRNIRYFQHKKCQKETMKESNKLHQKSKKHETNKRGKANPVII